MKKTPFGVAREVVAVGAAAGNLGAAKHPQQVTVELVEPRV